MRRPSVSVLLISLLGAVLFGCAQLDQVGKESAQKERPVARPLVLLDRFELREIRNGSTISNALLDKQMGRVWVLQGTKGNAMFVFSAVAVVPEPENVVGSLPPCPVNDPLGLQTSQPCAPLPSKEGKQQ